MTRPAILLCVLSPLAMLTGCVERKLAITSEPSGAVVYMNDKEIGRTPIDTDFTYYGNYDVQVRKDGYVTIDHPTDIKEPWWQVPPIDLFAELCPWHPTDHQRIHYRLTTRPASDLPPEEIMGRAVELKPLLESSLVPPPATLPAATQPALHADTQPAVTQPAVVQPTTTTKP